MIQVVVVGRVGKKWPLREFSSRAKVASISVADNRRMRNRDGEWDAKTVWVVVRFWNALAERVEKFVEVGQLVSVVGVLEEPEAYVDREGRPGVTLQVTGEKLEILHWGSRGGGGGELGVHVREGLDVGVEEMSEEVNF